MIVDAHVHIPTPDREEERLFREPGPAIDYLRKAGTDKALFTTWRGVLAATLDDLNAANEMALALAREYAGFLYPAVVVQPFFPEASIEWLTRFREQGFMWVGEQLPRSEPKCTFADAPYMRLFEECAKHGHVVQLHGTPEVREVAARFPDMPVVRSHIPDKEEGRLCAALPNLWQDVSGQCGGLVMGGLESALSAFGPDRLLYGTDFSGYEPRAFMARMNMAIPSPADREKIFHHNIVRLLAQAHSRPI